MQAFDDVIEVAQRLGDPTIEAIATANAAELEIRRGHDARAAALTQHANRLCVELGLRSNLAIGLMATARLAARAGRWDDALRLEAMGRLRLEATGLHLYESDEVLLAAMAEEAAEHVSAAQRGALDTEGRALDDFAAFQAASDILAELQGSGPEATAAGSRSGSPLE